MVNLGITGRLLIVNDDETTLEKLECMIKEEGIETTLSNVTSAFDKITYSIQNDIPYHAVLHGSNVSPLSGKKLVEKLRNTKVDGQTPFIFIMDKMDAGLYSEMCEVKPHAILPPMYTQDYAKKKVESAIEKGIKLYKK